MCGDKNREDRFQLAHISQLLFLSRDWEFVIPGLNSGAIFTLREIITYNYISLSDPQQQNVKVKLIFSYEDYPLSTNCRRVFAVVSKAYSQENLPVFPGSSLPACPSRSRPCLSLQFILYLRRAVTSLSWSQTIQIPAKNSLWVSQRRIISNFIFKHFFNI